MVAVASAVYAMVSMNKPGRHNQKDSKQGNFIYDVNVQGNKVKLMEIIPENFGFFKRYPDYLADRHVFYRNNTLFCDVQTGKGRADLVYEPDNPKAPLIIIEFKYGRSAEAAIKQIKTQEYFKRYRKLYRNIILVGINYSKATKDHQCLIEKL